MLNLGKLWSRIKAHLYASYGLGVKPGPRPLPARPQRSSLKSKLLNSTERTVRPIENVVSATLPPNFREAEELKKLEDEFDKVFNAAEDLKALTPVYEPPFHLRHAYEELPQKYKDALQLRAAGFTRAEIYDKTGVHGKTQWRIEKRGFFPLS